MTITIIATFDNTDPEVFGPFASYMEANEAVARVQAKIEAAGNTRHLEMLVLREMRAI